ncbi:MAG: glycosyltransferase family 2 protein [bacterium]
MEYSISVVIPVFNGEKLVGRAIESVLNQSHQPDEIIVIDDGSTDGTRDAVARFGSQVSYHHQQNAGSSVARNHGIALSTGNYLSFLDHDDIWTQNKLQTQVSVLNGHPGTEAVWGHVVEFSGDPKGIDITKRIPGYHPGTLLISRETFTRIGEFSVEFSQAEVADWVARAQRHDLQQVMLPDVLMYRCLHEDNKGKQNPDSRQQYLQVLKAHLDRKRQRD